MKIHSILLLILFPWLLTATETAIAGELWKCGSNIEGASRYVETPPPGTIFQCELVSRNPPAPRSLNLVCQGTETVTFAPEEEEKKKTELRSYAFNNGGLRHHQCAWNETRILCQEGKDHHVAFDRLSGRVFESEIMILPAAYQYNVPPRIRFETFEGVCQVTGNKKF